MCFNSPFNVATPKEFFIMALVRFFFYYGLLLGVLTACSSSEGDLVAQLRQKADHGDVTAQYQMGLLFYNGRGVERDLTQAAQWFTQAAEQNHGEAQFNLGVLYEHGQGVETSPAQALHWYMLAAQQSVEQSADALNRLVLALSTEQQAQALGTVAEFNAKHGLSVSIQREITDPPPNPPTEPVETTEPIQNN
jgi:TPR repeat protein